MRSDRCNLVRTHAHSIDLSNYLQPTQSPLHKSNSKANTNHGCLFAAQRRPQLPTCLLGARRLAHRIGWLAFPWNEGSKRKRSQKREK
jgi:hypothetical protein